MALEVGKGEDDVPERSNGSSPRLQRDELAVVGSL